MTPGQCGVVWIGGGGIGDVVFLWRWGRLIRRQTIASGAGLGKKGNIRKVMESKALVVPDQVRNTTTS